MVSYLKSKMKISDVHLHFLVIFVTVKSVVFCATYETIQTDLGLMKGEVIQVGTNRVYVFKSIPYAKPPIGSLRFKKPQPYGSWNGTLNATQDSPSCIQNKGQVFTVLKNKEITEDCLFLNIFVPREINVTDNRPVMIWIHGGGFISGQASFYDGSDIALTGDVIVVTINYRLGIFGFISSGDSLLPGNYGLWDQRMAMQWVKENIGSFGGDPSTITLFGESSGGISINVHAMNPINRGLFQRGILQSGNAIHKLVFPVESNFKQIAKEVNCFNSSSWVTSDIVDCLQHKPYDELLSASALLMNPFRSKLGLTIDGEYILGDPVKLLSDTSSPSYNLFRSLDMMIGNTNGEGSKVGFDVLLLKMDVREGINTTVLCDIFSPEIAKAYYSSVTSVSRAICEKYKVHNGGNIAEQSRKVADMIGDFYFIAPSVQLLDIHSYKNTVSKTYQYSFERDLFQPLFQAPWFQGAGHQADLPYLFMIEKWAARLQTQLSSGDHELSKDMLKYWTNFARNGNPNSLNDSSLVMWSEYDNEQRNYQVLDLNMTRKSNLFYDRVEFWLKTVPQIINPVIHSNSGPVKGRTLQYPEGTISQFRGIPFAKPPIGNLRFKKPEPVDAWNMTLDATTFKSPCMQAHLGFLTGPSSEDCLFLNIYVPGTVSNRNKKAVMVWIHGGGYTQGEGAIYDGSLLALKGNIIFVSLNYRLNVFGFLTSGDSVLKGNYGLWDQRLAIKWIKDNIAEFGGNPSAITIFGESAGGFSVSLQALSPINVGLFQRVIAQSGTALSPLAFTKTPRNLAIYYANLLNCTNVTSSEIAECLRNKPADDLLRVTDIIQFQLSNSYVSFDAMFKVSVDGELLMDDPNEQIKQSSSDAYKFFRSLDVMAGTTSNEGSLGILSLNAAQAHFNFDVLKGVPNTFMCDPWVSAITSALNLDKQSTSLGICNKYQPKNTDGNSSLGEYGTKTLDMFNDGFFLASTVEFLNWHSSQNYNGKSYQYLFSKRPPVNLEILLPKWFEGASHGSELRHLFGSLDTSHGNDDYVLSEIIMKYWTNFAKTGDPNEDGLPQWTDFGYAGKKMYLDFGSDTGTKTKEMLLSDRVKFWFDLKGLKYFDDTSACPTGAGTTFKEVTCIHVLIIAVLQKYL